MIDSKHPDLASEQAHVDRVHAAHALTLERRERAPEFAGDPHVSRQLRQRIRDKTVLAEDLERLCFARIDLVDGGPTYIGREAVYGETASDLLAISWQAPAAAPFYQASRGDPLGLRLRRRFQWQGAPRLRDLLDEVFVVVEGDSPGAAAEGEPAAPAGTGLEARDAILAEMERARGAEMRDIVATIEAAQYDLISSPPDGLLIIQGGPGTGKTAVALHRAAWLLYNHRESFERERVLVVGPNRAFMEYVSAVLPSLGEAAVEQQPIDRVAGPRDLRVRADEPVEVQRLKGDPRMVALIARAVDLQVQIPKKPLSVAIGGGKVQLVPTELAALAKEVSESTTTYERGRSEFRSRLASLSRSKVRGASKEKELSKKENERLRQAADRIWATVSPGKLVAELLSDPDFLAEAGAGILSDEERSQLLRDASEDLRQVPWTSADIPLVDEVQTLVEGLERIYGYAIVDEAQDLTPMQLRMVLRRTRDRKATLVGDMAQATGPWAYSGWRDFIDQLPDGVDARVAALPVGYRVPAQVMELAAPLVGRIADDLIAPEAVREGPEAPRLVKTTDEDRLATVEAEVHRRSDGERTVAVIAPPETIAPISAALEGAGLQVGDVRNDGLSRGVTLLTPLEAKGLEFDHTIVVEPEAMVAHYRQWAPLYVALTRCTRTLSVVHSSDEPVPSEMPPQPESAQGTGLGSLGLQSGSGLEPLGARFTEALMQAKFLHAGQQRRGTTVPYFAHLLATSSLVLEDGGSEDEAIAALLHDSVEDHGDDVFDQISLRFGAAVAEIVAGCTDPRDAAGTKSWRELKELHLTELEQAGAHVRRVSLAEKLDNARAIARDFQRFGPALWERMEVEADEILWYFDALADLFGSERPGDMADELRATVDQLLEAATAGSPESTKQPAATSL